LDGTVLTHRVCFSLSLPSFFSIGYQIWKWENFILEKQKKSKNVFSS
jgi:hypothetical protein